MIVFPLLIIMKAAFWLPWHGHFVTVGEYVAVLRTCPEDPLVNLCIGLTFIHLAGQKYSSKKHSLFAQVRCRCDLYLSVLISCRKWMFKTNWSCFKSCDFYLHGLHVLQGLTFINNYVELRGECQETYYNLGRALHQLGMNFEPPFKKTVCLSSADSMFKLWIGRQLMVFFNRVR